MYALLELDAALASADGDAHRAIGSSRALLNPSRSIGDEPFLISQLIRVAGRQKFCHTLERLLGQSTERIDIAELQVIASADLRDPLLLYGLRGDRAGFHLFFRNMTDGTIKPDNAGTFDQFGWWLFRGRLPENHAFILEVYSNAIETLKRNPHELVTTRVTHEPLDESRHKMAALMMPDIAKVSALFMRTEAKLAATVVALACERFRQRTNRWPDRLDEIPADLLRARSGRRGPGPTSSSATTTLSASDFVGVKSLTTSGIVDLYVLFVLHIGTRRVFVAGVTAAPNAEWVTQQARNFTMAAADMKLGVTHLLIDHDTKFTAAFDAVLAADGVAVKRVGPRAPNMNAHAERFVQISRHKVLAV